MFRSKLTARYEVVANLFASAFKKLLDDPETRQSYVDEAPDESFQESYEWRLSNFLKTFKSDADFNGGELVIYRCLNVPVESFDPTKPLGDHWTYSDSNVRCWDQDRGGKDNWIILVATVPATSVDFDQTLRQNASYDEEQEITIKDGAVVHLRYIKSYMGEDVLKEFKPAFEAHN